MHYVSLLQVHKSTHQNSLDKAADLLYWIMLIATVDTQPLLLVMTTLGIVLPVEKILASGVTVSVNYSLFVFVVHILHLYTFLCRMYTCTRGKNFL